MLCSGLPTACPPAHTVRCLSQSPLYLEVSEAQFTAEELMLLPHVLLQVPKEGEGRQVQATWTFMLQQLPGKTEAARAASALWAPRPTALPPAPSQPHTYKASISLNLPHL